MIFDAWRYLRLDAQKVLSLTPRELTIMMRAEVERRYDEYEKFAHFAIMREKAHREKRPKASDLFKRPPDEEVAKNKTEDLLSKKEKTMEWLSQFEQFKYLRKEAADGKS